MSRIIYTDVKGTITAVGGTGQVTTERMNGELVFIYVKATTSTNEFDFQIIDPSSRILRPYTDEVDTLYDSEILPVKGKHTLKVLNADVSEAFDYLLKVREIT